MKKLLTGFNLVRAVLIRVAIGLYVQPPIQLLVAAVWFALVAALVPYLIQLAIILAPFIVRLFQVWAGFHFAFAIGKILGGMFRSQKV